MSTMIFEVFDAFRSAGVPEEKARKAAEAISNETAATKSDIQAVRSDIAKLDKEIAVLKWMLGLVMAGVATQVLKSFF